jgi:hypothetical protein
VRPRGVRRPRSPIGRLAACGTGLRFGEPATLDGPIKRWWQSLINNAAAYDPASRWTMADVVIYLRAKPAVVPRESAEQRLTCHGDRGHDSAERCLTCHTLSPY